MLKRIITGFITFLVFMGLAFVPSASSAPYGGSVYNFNTYWIRADTNSNKVWDTWIQAGKGLAGVDNLVLPPGTCLYLRDYPNGKVYLYGSFKNTVIVPIANGTLKRADAYYCSQIYT